MNKIINLILTFKKDPKEVVFEQLVKCFDNLIRKNLNKVDEEYRDDLKQEIYYSVYVYLRKFQIKFDYKLDKKIVSSFNQKYFGSSEVAWNDLKNLSNIYYEYCLFCNENQFVNYFEKIVKSKTYMYKNKTKHISLNDSNSFGIELLETLSDDSNNNSISFEDFDSLTENELELLKLLIVDNYTEKEIALKYNVTQQTISKRKNYYKSETALIMER